jgi:hypothetical protein
MLSPNGFICQEKGTDTPSVWDEPGDPETRMVWGSVASERAGKEQMEAGALSPYIHTNVYAFLSTFKLSDSFLA